MPQGMKLALVFSVGLLVGAVAAGTIVGRHWIRNFVDWYALGVADQAWVAGEIYRGQGAELAETIADALPAYVLALDGDLKSSAFSNQALWLVQEVYELSEKAVPTEIEPILEALPPKPVGCCKLPSRLEVLAAED